MTVTRALGKTEAKFLADLASADKAIFTTDDARAATRSSASAVNLLIAGLIAKKWLVRLNRGTYLIVPLSAGENAEYSENWFVVARSLIEPADYYLSHFSALEIHEMTANPVLTVYVSTPVRRIEKQLAGATYRFICVRPENMWGLTEVWATPSQRVRASDLERTIIDCLDRPDLCGGVHEVAKGLWVKRDEIDLGRLADYTKRLGRKSVAKRLGYLLDVFELGNPEFEGALKEMVSESYALLDPTLPDEGRRVRKWRVRVNLDPDELRAALKT